jgi:hypothetical protein
MEQGNFILLARMSLMSPSRNQLRFLLRRLILPWRLALGLASGGPLPLRTVFLSIFDYLLIIKRSVLACRFIYVENVDTVVRFLVDLSQFFIDFTPVPFETVLVYEILLIALIGIFLP